MLCSLSFPEHKGWQLSSPKPHPHKPTQDLFLASHFGLWKVNCLVSTSFNLILSNSNYELRDWMFRYIF